MWLILHKNDRKKNFKPARIALYLFKQVYLPFYLWWIKKPSNTFHAQHEHKRKKEKMRNICHVNNCMCMRNKIAGTFSEYIQNYHSSFINILKKHLM
jgi:hypothetical protein